MNIPINQRIDKTKLERHPSGDGWLVPMRNGEKAQVLCFERKGFQEPILGLNEDSRTLGWLPDGRFIGTHEHRCDLMLDAYIDPYAELKAAHAAGKVIQAQWSADRWLDLAGGPDWTLAESQYRIKPEWTLGRSVNGFTLGEGQEWHRNDFTEDMLADGWRPLILGELEKRSDEWRDSDGGWHSHPGENHSAVVDFHRRTRRPLPEVKKPVPLGPEDVKCGDEIKAIEGNQNRLAITEISPLGIYTHRSCQTWKELQTHCQISRDGGKTWEACSK